jgi:hypothetical protein
VRCTRRLLSRPRGITSHPWTGYTVLMSETPDPDELVCVYSAANIMEAHVVRNVLLDAEIDAEVSERAGESACDVVVRLADEAIARAAIAKSKP